MGCAARRPRLRTPTPPGVASRHAHRPLRHQLTAHSMRVGGGGCAAAAGQSGSAQGLAHPSPARSCDERAPPLGDGACGLRAGTARWRWRPEAPSQGRLLAWVAAWPAAVAAAPQRTLGPALTADQQEAGCPERCHNPAGRHGRLGGGPAGKGLLARRAAPLLPLPRVQLMSWTHGLRRGSGDQRFHAHGARRQPGWHPIFGSLAR